MALQGLTAWRAGTDVAGRKPKAVCCVRMRTETCSEEAANLARGGGGGFAEVTAEQSSSPWREQGEYSRWREQHKLKLSGWLCQWPPQIQNQGLSVS